MLASKRSIQMAAVAGISALAGLALGIVIAGVLTPESDDALPMHGPEKLHEGGTRPTARAEPEALHVEAVSGEISEEDQRWMRDALAAEKRRRAAAAFDEDDTGLDTLQKVLEHDADIAPLFTDFDAFTAPLRRFADVVEVVPVTPETLDEVIRSYRGRPRSRVRFEFAPGDYEVRGNFRLDRVAHVTFRGAGRDLTRLDARSEFIVAAQLDNLTIEGMTIDTAGSGSDPAVSSHAAAASLVRSCRFTGFDRSAAFTVQRSAYAAFEDCEFLGGFCEVGALQGAAVKVESRSLVYFRGCLFREIEGFIRAAPSAEGSTIKVEDCRSVFTASTGHYGPGVSVIARGSSFTSYLDSEWARGPRIDLGGNVFESLRPWSQPTLLDFLGRLSMDDVVEAGLAPRSVMNVTRDALHVVTTHRDGVERLWFNDPSGTPGFRWAAAVDGFKEPPRVPLGPTEAIEIAFEEGSANDRPIALWIRLGAPEIDGVPRDVWSVMTIAAETLVDARDGSIVGP